MARVLSSIAFAALAASAAGLVTGCSGGHQCTPPAGGRCAGPEALTVYAPSWGGARHLTWGVALSPDGRTITAVVPCGGELRTKEGRDVSITWVASSVGAGGMSCARVPLTVRLTRPLGARELLDGVTGAQLHPLLCDGSGDAVFNAHCR